MSVCQRKRWCLCDFPRQKWVCIHLSILFTELWREQKKQQRDDQMIKNHTHTRKHTLAELREFSCNETQNKIPRWPHLLALLPGYFPSITNRHRWCPVFSVTPGYLAPEVPTISASIQCHFICWSVTLRAEASTNYSPCLLVVEE